MSPKSVIENAHFGEQDIHLFREGTHGRLYRRFGCTLADGEARFVVWAPNAQAVSIVGDFNNWHRAAAPARARSDDSGIWEIEVSGLVAGQGYKFAIRTQQGQWLEKADPFARRAECPPATGSVVHEAVPYDWHDAAWMAQRAAKTALDAPIAVYEVHLGSWRRAADGSMLGYRDAAARLVEHVQRMGFTHVELMPITEHPFYGSWGYQTTGYFAPTSRYGTPEDFKFLVDTLHQAGIGVILDWVPSHFPADAHGLAQFDGTYLYEHADPRQGFHPEWNSSIFNYGRNEVRSFLLSSALFWLDEFHIDGCASTRWPRCCTSTIRARRASGSPTASAAARTSRPSRSCACSTRPSTATTRRADDRRGIHRLADGVAAGLSGRPGLRHEVEHGLDARHAGLHAADPVYRRWHHGQLTFSLVYAFNENFMLPLSHDEVVHGKGSLINKMPGDDWQKFANLRVLSATCGRTRARSCCSWAANSASGANGRTTASSIGSFWTTRPMPACALGRRPEPLLPREPGAARARLRVRRIRMGRLQRRREQRVELSCASRATAGCGAGGGQLHAVAARRLPGRRAASGTLARAHEQRRHAVRRQRRRQPGRRRLGAGVHARPFPCTEPDPAAAGPADVRASNRGRDALMSRPAVPQAKAQRSFH
jgi:1,4-alpha-glucan branching enzyme